MLDLHAHLLPGLDDGPEELAASLEMARAYVALGFRGVVATPHFYPGLYEPAKEEITEKLAQLKAALAKEEIPLEVFPGAEYLLTPELPERFARGELLTLAGSRYLLVELPWGSFPPYTFEVIFALFLKGVTPVLAHPERHGFLLARPALLEELSQKGVLLQLTAGSITGLFGEEEKRTARRLLKEGKVHFVASDAHGVGKRLKAAAEAAKLVDRKLLSHNPWAVVKDEALPSLSGRGQEKG